MNTHLTNAQENSFTLIEMLVYVGILSIFITGAILFTWDIILGGAKSTVQREVNENIRLATKRISYEIRNASQLISLTSSDLCLASASAARNPTRIYVASSRLRIAWGGGSVNCTSMTNDQPLTSNLVGVSSFTLTNQSSGSNTIHIGYVLTIAATGTRKEWQKSTSYTSSAELRSH